MKKILIIEDDSAIAEIEKDYLTLSGLDAAIITDGKKGLEEAQSGLYDLILLDLMLPGTDGFSICRIQAGTAGYPHPHRQCQKR